MKKLNLSLILLMFLSISISAQTSSIKIYTDMEDETSFIKVYLNGEPQDAMFNDEVLIEDLYPGKYDLIVSFNSDTIADYTKKITIKMQTDIIYKVELKGEFGKEAGKMGRAVGHKFGTTEADDQRELYEYYKLVLVSGKDK
jgi:hypothetical protein